VVQQAPAIGSTGGRGLRLELELRLPAPGWGFMNITGPLQAWSFTKTLPVAPDPLVSPTIERDATCFACSVGLP